VVKLKQNAAAPDSATGREAAASRAPSIVPWTTVLQRGPGRGGPVLSGSAWSEETGQITANRRLDRQSLRCGYRQVTKSALRYFDKVVPQPFRRVILLFSVIFFPDWLPSRGIRHFL